VTTKRILVLHGYSAANRGDGLLVDESLELIREVYGGDADVDLVTSYPDSFNYTGLRTFRSKPSFRGFSRAYLELLGSKFNNYDLVVGVGGGYLRFGTPTECLKTVLVMGPQLLAAALSSTPTVYLPQSVGPARFGFRLPLGTALRKLDRVWVRDDRSLGEFPEISVQRAPDLAILGMQRSSLAYDPGLVPVVSVREHRGGVPVGARDLANKLLQFDGYIQSSVAGNDDTAAVASLRPVEICSFDELMGRPTSARIVVAMRLHAALMAIAAGHYVIHLAYERKGFGAFEDLGLEDYVHNVHDFDVEEVELKVRALANNSEARRKYDKCVANSAGKLKEGRDRVLASLQPNPIDSGSRKADLS